MGWFSPRTIRAEVRRRKISLLLHSTHLYRNLPQILTDGFVFTVRDLIRTYGEEKAARFLHDPARYEQFTVGRDYLNGALSVPNYELLYRRSKANWKAEWVHLSLDISCLWEESTRFCAVSAAAERGKHIRSGVEGLSTLFAGQIENSKRSGLPKHIPTHPQAEVLIRGSLPLNKVIRIYTADEAARQEVERLAALHARTIPIEAAPALFVWPERLMPK